MSKNMLSVNNENLLKSLIVLAFIFHTDNIFYQSRGRKKIKGWGPHVVLFPPPLHTQTKKKGGGVLQQPNGANN